MRTVTFSDAAVAKLVNDGFVATWVNRNPKFHNCELDTEVNIAKYSGEAYATRNFCTFFVTPELDVLHYLAGYYRPTWFLHEAEFALAARLEAYDGQMKPKKDCGRLVASLHEKHAAEHKAQEKRLAGVTAGDWKESDSSGRFHGNTAYLREAVTYLGQLHTELGKGHAAGRPTKLADVIKAYKAPNTFTEE